jgi:uncharacterized LabA/DUF88 family protein
MSTAILVDGDFFLRRFRSHFGQKTPKETARELHKLCLDHLHPRKSKQEQAREPDTRELYRIFFYDCPPLSKKVHNPITGRAIDFAKTELALWRIEFHDELRRLRKVALHLGYVNERSGSWQIRSEKTKELLEKRAALADLTEADVYYDVQQKGVDMKIGLDIASLAYKRFVRQIVLISGDSDFVPAAKLARREGIDFILDPLGANIRPDLFEHIDGLRNLWKEKGHSCRPKAKQSTSPDDLR